MVRRKKKIIKPRNLMDPEKYMVPEELRCGRELLDGSLCRAPRKYGTDGCRYHHSDQPVSQTRQPKGTPRLEIGPILRFGVVPKTIRSLDEILEIQISLVNALATGGLDEKKAAVLQKSLDAIQRTIETIVKNSPETHKKKLETINAIAQAARDIPLVDARRILVDRNFLALEDYIQVEVTETVNESEENSIAEAELKAIEYDGRSESGELSPEDEGEIC